MIRTKGEAGTGDVVEAVRHMRAIVGEIRRLDHAGREELMTEAKDLGRPTNWCSGWPKPASCPCRTSLRAASPLRPTPRSMMQLGAEAVFVGSGIFKSATRRARAKAIVQATTHYKDPDVLAKVAEDLGDAMPGIDAARMPEEAKLQHRGW